MFFGLFLQAAGSLHNKPLLQLYLSLFAKNDAVLTDGYARRSQIASIVFLLLTPFDYIPLCDSHAHSSAASRKLIAKLNLHRNER